MTIPTDYTDRVRALSGAEQAFAHAQLLTYLRTHALDVVAELERLREENSRLRREAKERIGDEAQIMGRFMANAARPCPHGTPGCLGDHQPLTERCHVPLVPPEPAE